MVHSRLDKHGEWSARIKSHPRLTPKQTSVFDAAFSASGDSATKQLSGLSWRGFVSWKRVEKNRLVMVQFGSDGFYVCSGLRGFKRQS